MQYGWNVSLEGLPVDPGSSCRRAPSCHPAWLRTLAALCSAVLHLLASNYPVYRRSEGTGDWQPYLGIQPGEGGVEQEARVLVDTWQGLMRTSLGWALSKQDAKNGSVGLDLSGWFSVVEPLLWSDYIWDMGEKKANQSLGSQWKPLCTTSKTRWQRVFELVAILSQSFHVTHCRKLLNS